MVMTRVGRHQQGCELVTSLLRGLVSDPVEQLRQWQSLEFGASPQFSLEGLREDLDEHGLGRRWADIGPVFVEEMEPLVELVWQFLEALTPREVLQFGPSSDLYQLIAAVVF